LAKPELGAKQLCPNCAAKFYDLTKRPAVCPKCHTAFDPEEVVKIRRVRTRAEKADYDDDELPAKASPETVDGFEDEVDDTPEIDQAIEDDVVEVDDEAEGDGGTAKPAPADDLGVDFAVDDDVVDDEADEDVPFLEDEDEDGFSEDDIVVPGEDE
jgi:uncharacterized protein (TIGR02300 family)